MGIRSTHESRTGSVTRPLLAAAQLLLGRASEPIELVLQLRRMVAMGAQSGHNYAAGSRGAERIGAVGQHAEPHPPGVDGQISRISQATPPAGSTMRLSSCRPSSI